jgi:hypothetical protein
LSVVYTAAWEGGAAGVCSVRFDRPESRSPGLPPADLLSILGRGELALGLGRRFGFGWKRIGTHQLLALRQRDRAGATRARA